MVPFLPPDGDEEFNGDAPENDDYRSEHCDVDEKDNSDTEEVTLKADGLCFGNCTYMCNNNNNNILYLDTLSREETLFKGVYIGTIIYKLRTL